jgi:hypothetical protein
MTPEEVIDKRRALLDKKIYMIDKCLEQFAEEPKQKQENRSRK